MFPKQLQKLPTRRGYFLPGMDFEKIKQIFFFVFHLKFFQQLQNEKSPAPENRDGA